MGSFQAKRTIERVIFSCAKHLCIRSGGRHCAQLPTPGRLSTDAARGYPESFRVRSTGTVRAPCVAWSAMVGEDPPQNAGNWWVFAALDHTLHSGSHFFG